MNQREEIIKSHIARELASFLLSERSDPIEVVLTVRYAESTATLRFDGKEIFEKMP